MVETFINPANIGSTGLMLTVLGYLIKKWINGTTKEINELKKNKMEIGLCDSRREACDICFNGIRSDMEEVHSQLKNLTDNIPILTQNQKDVIKVLDKITSQTR